jgi:tetratricopeptide (TPR) repeat protein
VFVQPPEATRDRKAVTHVEQMMASRCYRESHGKMGCISCHDPHVYPRPAERVAFYRQRCLTCHQDAHCILPVAKRRTINNNSCFECHMPRVENTDVAHSAASDHRVVLAPGKMTAAKTDPRRRLLRDVPLVYFFEGEADPYDREVLRDFALGLIELVHETKPGPARTSLLTSAVSMLDEALAVDPDDVPVLHARGYALWLQGIQNEALADFEAVLQKAPDAEETLSYAGQLALAQDRLPAAEGYWRRAIAANPWEYTYHQQLAEVYSKLGRTAEAIEEYRKTLTLNPFDDRAEGRLVNIFSAISHAQARKEFDKLILLVPENSRDIMRQKFEQAMQPK